MTQPKSPFENGLRLMEAQQQLAARSLLNMIEMISTTSHRMASDTSSFAREALEIMNEAAKHPAPSSLAELQKKWSATCMRYGQDQTRAAMSFVEQCGVQALSVVTKTQTPPDDQTPPDAS